MRTVDPGNRFEIWRDAARQLLSEKVPPGEILWGKETVSDLFETTVSESGLSGRISVPAAFVELARTVACHADSERWGLLYRILWRMTQGGERALLEIASDRDMVVARRMEKAVRREVHKMHAFVRFRKVGEDERGRERYVAWFEPDHFIVELAIPFFVKRFANFDWMISTPKGCAHWIDGILHIRAGVLEDPFEHEDAYDEAWKVYYRSIFNPARLKVKMMTSEMPRRYWKNLPEAGIIEELIRQGNTRVQGMLDEAPRQVRSMPRNAYLQHLRELGDEVPE